MKGYLKISASRAFITMTALKPLTALLAAASGFARLSLKMKLHPQHLHL